MEHCLPAYWQQLASIAGFAHCRIVKSVGLTLIVSLLKRVSVALFPSGNHSLPDLPTAMLCYLSNIIYFKKLQVGS
jgi:hypothetical protein